MGVPLVIGLLFFVLGIALLISSVVSFIKKRRQVAASSSAAGVVTELVKEMGQRGYLYYPQVQFTTASGQTISFKSSVGSNPATYRAGQNVEVIYDPRNPQQAEIDSLTSLWIVPGCLLGMGLVFTVIGLVLSGMMILVVVNQS